MEKAIRSRNVLLSGAIAVGIVVAFGVFHAFSRGANDFSVFFEAWRLVLSGRGAEIYKVSPDRYLYGPGFAWLLAVFAGLPKNVALVMWCAAKISVIGFIAHQMSSWISNESSNPPDSSLSLGLSLWGIAWVARPVLLDFSYGQVNLFILGACIWALLGHFNSSRSRFGDVLSWGVLTSIALSKLFPLPLLGVPWLVAQGIKKEKLKSEKVGIILGVMIALVPPILSLGWRGVGQLLVDWRNALISKGLPLESHNQSFVAFLHHYLSGQPTRIQSEGPAPLSLGWSVLSMDQIGLLSLFWTFSTLGIALAWIGSGNRHKSLEWSVVAVALLIVPSHLIWKPYFVLTIPLAVLFLYQVYKKGDWISYLTAIGIFIGINLTGFDFVGHWWSAHFEASSIILFMHVILIFLVVRNGRKIG
jgi:hypothetical protein